MFRLSRWEAEGRKIEARFFRVVGCRDVGPDARRSGLDPGDERVLEHAGVGNIGAPPVGTERQREGQASHQHTRNNLFGDSIEDHKTEVGHVKHIQAQPVGRKLRVASQAVRVFLYLKIAVQAYRSQALASDQIKDAHATVVSFCHVECAIVGGDRRAHVDALGVGICGLRSWRRDLLNFRFV